MCEDLLIDSN